MALGQRDVPDLDEEADVELMIGAREQYRGLGDSTVEHRPTEDAVIVTDGGAVVGEPEITRHVEPESQALVRGEPASYFRCECCGVEAMSRKIVEAGHREGCEASRRL